MLVGTAASAQIGEHLVPPLDTPLPLLSPTPLPTLPLDDPPVLDGDLDDPVNELLGGGEDSPPPDEDEGQPVADPTNEPTTSDEDQRFEPASGGSSDGTPETGGGTGATSDPATAADDDAGAPTTLSASTRTYPAVAARATVAAIGRALRLAAPLAPPLILAAISLVGLLAIGRGTDRMFKLEALRPQSRTYRL